jgi:hypothetical protein
MRSKRYAHTRRSVEFRKKEKKQYAAAEKSEGESNCIIDLHAKEKKRIELYGGS